MIPVLRQFLLLISEAFFPPKAAERALQDLQTGQALSVLPPAPSPPFQRCHSIFAYKDERVKALIWNIKYKRNIHSVEIAAFCLYEKIKSIAKNAGKDDFQSILIIPMPVTPQRRKERGYNQCELLTQKMESLYSNDVNKSGNLYFENKLLLKTHHTSRQTLKNRNERLKSAKGLFSVNPLRFEDHKTKSQLIVIDDVITTGSTMKDALESLQKAGYEDCMGLSVAH